MIERHGQRGRGRRGERIDEENIKGERKLGKRDQRGKIERPKEREKEVVK